MAWPNRGCRRLFSSPSEALVRAEDSSSVFKRTTTGSCCWPSLPAPLAASLGSCSCSRFSSGGAQMRMEEQDLDRDSMQKHGRHTWGGAHFKEGVRA
eukprot:1136222-Pelagomonas_calceolata.AAC.3